MDDSKIPEIYSDGVQIGLGPFGAVLSFTLQPIGQTGPSLTQVCIIRMSIEHAKVLAILLKKQVKQYEGQLGEELPIHPQVYTQLGISRQEDW
ncbi:MAG: DUF3467 domain-containing protein [Gemmatimonadales bacterium]